ncbi:MAG: hypothetical protein E6Q97_03815 [Desulfurellales bacterium]|jgi:hypothetical protein|nr:MAG: hypothetical protein E6Q97_03815 [Desulfurellales bacterium]
MKALLLLIVLWTAGCAASNNRLGADPADLTAPGAPRQDLANSGWEISEPVSPTSSNLPAPDDPSADGQSWSNFVSALTPSDELRPVRNNAGIGYAIFRGGKFLDLYLVTIF